MKEINKIPYSRVYQIHRRQWIYNSHETDYEEKMLGPKGEQLVEQDLEEGQNESRKRSDDKEQEGSQGFPFFTTQKYYKISKKCPDLFACLQKPYKVAAAFHERN